MKLIFYLFVGLYLCFTSSLQAQEKKILIPKSTILPSINGIIEPEEWNDARTFYFENKEALNTKVHIKHNGENLYIVFENLKDAKNIRLNPEILIDTNANNTQWTNSCFWFHSSHSNCFSVGEYYNWTNCAKNQEGWQANSLPFVNDNNNIEFKISYKKLGVDPKKHNVLKIAFKISNVKDQHFYYPSNASIESPSSWLEITI